MDDQEIIDDLERVLFKIKISPNHWRFNYSVGLSSGSCYGGTYEDENKLIKKGRK